MFIEIRPFGYPELCSETSIPWIKFKRNCYSFSTVLDSMTFEAAHEFCKKEGNSFVMVKCFWCAISWHFSKQCVAIFSFSFAWLFSDFRSNKNNLKNKYYWICLFGGNGKHMKLSVQHRIWKPKMISQMTVLSQKKQKSFFWMHLNYEFLMFPKVNLLCFDFLSTSLYLLINVVFL